MVERSQKGQRLRIVAVEPFATRGNLSESVLTSLLAETTGIGSPALPVHLALPAGAPRVFAIKPSHPTANDDVTTQAALLVGLEDDLQVVVGIAIDGVPPTSKACPAYALRLAATVQAGQRKLESTSGWRRLDTSRGPGTLSILLPKGWFVETDEGVDFNDWRIHWPTTLDHRRELGIYEGTAPSFHPGSDKHVIGKLFGTNVTWYDGVAGSVRVSEALVPRRQEVLHIWIYASSADEINVLRAAGLTLKDAK